jgi:hypothetical protein
MYTETNGECPVVKSQMRSQAYHLAQIELQVGLRATQMGIDLQTSELYEIRDRLYAVEVFNWNVGRYEAAWNQIIDRFIRHVKERE